MDSGLANYVLTKNIVDVLYSQMNTNVYDIESFPKNRISYPGSNTPLFPNQKLENKMYLKNQIYCFLANVINRGIFLEGIMMGVTYLKRVINSKKLTITASTFNDYFLTCICIFLKWNNDNHDITVLFDLIPNFNHLYSVYEYSVLTVIEYKLYIDKEEYFDNYYGLIFNMTKLSDKYNFFLSILHILDNFSNQQIQNQTASNYEYSASLIIQLYFQNENNFKNDLLQSDCKYKKHYSNTIKPQ